MLVKYNAGVFQKERYRFKGLGQGGSNLLKESNLPTGPCTSYFGFFTSNVPVRGLGSWISLGRVWETQKGLQLLFNGTWFGSEDSVSR